MQVRQTLRCLQAQTSATRRQRTVLKRRTSSPINKTMNQLLVTMFSFLTLRAKRKVCHVTTCQVEKEPLSPYA